MAKITYELLPDRALKFRQNYSHAIIELNNQDLVKAKPGATGESIRKRAPSLLKSAPLTASVFWQLGLIEYTNGSAAGTGYDQAKQFLQIAQKRNPRNQATAIGQHDIGALTGNYGEAVEQLDLLMRLSEERVDTYLPLMLAIARNPKGRDVLTKTVLQNPIWAPSFMQQLIFQEGKYPVLSVAIIDEAAQSNSVSFNADGTLQSLLKHLVSLGEYEKAKKIWQSKNFKNATQTNHIYDGNFSNLKGELPFNWFLQQSEQGYAAFDSPSGLLVSSNGRKQTFLAQQMIVLPQKQSYVLQVEVQGQFRSRKGGFIVAVICAGTGEKLGEMIIDKLKTGAQTFSMEFAVKDTQCRAQNLQIFGKKAQFPSQIQMIVNNIEVREASQVPPKGDE